MYWSKLTQVLTNRSSQQKYKDYSYASLFVQSFKINLNMKNLFKFGYARILKAVYDGYLTQI